MATPFAKRGTIDDLRLQWREDALSHAGLHTESKPNSLLLDKLTHKATQSLARRLGIRANLPNAVLKDKIAQRQHVLRHNDGELLAAASPALKNKWERLDHLEQLDSHIRLLCAEGSEGVIAYADDDDTGGTDGSVGASDGDGSEPDNGEKDVFDVNKKNNEEAKSERDAQNVDKTAVAHRPATGSRSDSKTLKGSEVTKNDDVGVPTPDGCAPGSTSGVATATQPAIDNDDASTFPDEPELTPESVRAAAHCRRQRVCMKVGEYFDVRCHTERALRKWQVHRPTYIVGPPRGSFKDHLQLHKWSLTAKRSSWNGTTTATTRTIARMRATHPGTTLVRVVEREGGDDGWGGKKSNYFRVVRVIAVTIVLPEDTPTHTLSPSVADAGKGIHCWEELSYDVMTSSAHALPPQ
eukprot:GFYU01007759.1.p1 GENE.GFYU01007759.1~~GFYU01007759.1.p1  ORF type:complete len:410 (+),score=52.57 GFYU01007759.1:110-1339(+)